MGPRRPYRYSNAARQAGDKVLKRPETSHQPSRFNFMREAQIWCSRSPEQRPISSEFEYVVVLSDDFYEEILAHPVPNDLEAVKVLAASPAILDLHMRLSYRSFKA